MVIDVLEFFLDSFDGGYNVRVFDVEVGDDVELCDDSLEIVFFMDMVVISIEIFFIVDGKFFGVEEGIEEFLFGGDFVVVEVLFFGD